MALITVKGYYNTRNPGVSWTIRFPRDWPPSAPAPRICLVLSFKRPADVTKKYHEEKDDNE